MNEFLERILNLLSAYFTKKQSYEWKFLTVNGTEPNQQIKVSNSIEYEFINSGTTIVLLSNGLKIYPAFMNVEPARVKFSINKNEVDVSVYEYNFIPLTVNDQVGGFTFGVTEYYYNSHAFELTGYVPINRLQVIIKQVSRQ